MSKPKTWTDRADRLLAKYFHMAMLDDELGELLGRDEAAIVARRRHLGLLRPGELVEEPVAAAAAPQPGFEGPLGSYYASFARQAAAALRRRRTA